MKDYTKKKRKKRKHTQSKTAPAVSSKKARVTAPEQVNDDVKLGDVVSEMPAPLPRTISAPRRKQMKISQLPPSDKKTRAWDNKLRMIAALQTPEQPIWETERVKKTTYKGPGRSKIYKINTKTTVVSSNKKQVYDCTRIRKGGRTKNAGPCRPVISNNQ